VNHIGLCGKVAAGRRLWAEVAGSTGSAGCQNLAQRTRRSPSTWITPSNTTGDHVFTDDIPFYLEYTERIGSPVVEVACGTGRLLVLLSAENDERAFCRDETVREW